MANFYAFVQPTGNSGEYLVNLFFTDMQSAFNTSSYLSVGLCSESFADGAASVSGVLWEENATPYFYGNWHYRQLSTSDANSFYPNGSYTLYAFARDADNGQYWHFNAGLSTTIYIRSVQPSVRMGPFYAAVSFDDLCVPWNRINYDLIGLSTVDFADGSAFEFEQGYWEVQPQSGSGNNYGTDIYLEEGMTANATYSLIPYARLPNGELYHLLAPGETITFTYVPAPDGPVTVTGKPTDLSVSTAYTNEIDINANVDYINYDLFIKTTCFETGEVVYWQDYHIDTWDFESGGQNVTVWVQGLAPSSTYEIEMRYAKWDVSTQQYVIGTQKSVVYAVTEPEITYASAEIYMQDNVHKLVVHTVGSTFGTETEDEDWFLSMYITDNRGHAKRVNLPGGFYVKDYEYITEIPSGWYLIDEPGYEGYSVYINTQYETPYSGVFGIQGGTVRESGTYAVNNIHPTDRPRYFRWTTCADDNGHKRARAAPAVMTKAEWDALQQTALSMYYYRGGQVQWTLSSANIGDPVSADLYEGVQIVIRNAGNGTEYGSRIPEIHKGDRMYASHFNILMDELNAASGYNVNISN